MVTKSTLKPTSGGLQSPCPEHPLGRRAGLGAHPLAGVSGMRFPAGGRQGYTPTHTHTAPSSFLPCTPLRELSRFYKQGN